MAARLNEDPLLAGIAHVSKLSGLSGTRVYLASRDGQQWFVRKAASDATSGERLRRQVAKQIHFTTHIKQPRVPRILEQGLCGDCFYFDMEFVRGSDAATFLRNADYGAVQRFADILSGYMSVAAVSQPALPAHGNFFMSLFRKLAVVQRKTHGLSAESLAALFLALDRLSDIELPATLCHGDLTFDNLIVTSSSDGPVLWTVDLLDAPYEHYWNDLAKLHQDLTGGWYLRNQPRIAQCVTDFVSRRLLARAGEIDPRYLQFHEALMGITFARILPYVINDTQREFVRRRVEYFAYRAGAVARRTRP